MNFFWFLPASGDGHYLGTEIGVRQTDYSYYKQIAQAADRLGYTGVLVPTGRYGEDPWILAASLLPVTERLRFLVAVRPGVYSPSVIARMSSTFDRLSNGRLLLNIVSGGDTEQLKGDGIFLDHDARYEATDEFLTIWKELHEEKEVDFHGKYLQIKGGKLLLKPQQQPHPSLYFGGSSQAGLAVAAKHVDFYLTWGEPPAQVAEKIERVRKLADAQGRTVRFGVRLQVIVRRTEQEAWDAANELIRYVDDKAIAIAQEKFAKSDSEGQHRISQLHGGNRDTLEISPNLWAGIGLVRGGAGTALVGDPETVAARIQEYADLGIETFVLSGYPHLEEAYRFAELLFPLLPVNQEQSVSHEVSPLHTFAR